MVVRNVTVEDLNTEVLAGVVVSERESLALGLKADVLGQSPHDSNVVRCASCGRRWIAVRPLVVAITDLHCPRCNSQRVEDDDEAPRDLTVHPVQ